MKTKAITKKEATFLFGGRVSSSSSSLITRGSLSGCSLFLVVIIAFTGFHSHPPTLTCILAPPRYIAREELEEHSYFGCMGFWSSYKRLPRSQRILLGLTGIVIGWYGPSWMTYLVQDPGLLVKPKRDSEK